MAELEFRGKEFVRNHHLTVPFRPLVPDPSKSIGPADLDGNLIIHGDNLQALKALLPRYAGKVDCIFIDPPYNTGNEGWSYNDNVNSPLMREWLKANPVNAEDLLRHDKWCCMMWPRLRLLHELLADTGSLWMTLDDNESHRGRALLDEIFGEHNALVQCVWQKKYAAKSDSKHISSMHDNVLVYAKDSELVEVVGLDRTAEQDARYSNTDDDPRGPWASGDLLRNEVRENRLYDVVSWSGKVSNPPRGASWRFPPERMQELIADNRIWFGEDGNNMPRIKRFLSRVRDTVPPTSIWPFSDVGSSDSAKKEFLDILPEAADERHTPKPVPLVERIVNLAMPDDGLLLDSFAGTGTSGHSVLRLNNRDGGTRRFILAECENYADSRTAERVRRVINGYAFQGTQRETLLERNLTWTEFKKAGALVAEVDAIKEEKATEFDAIKTEVKDGKLRVTGERAVAETAPGLGGTFTYCTLGEPVHLDRILSGHSLPTREALGEWLLFTSFGKAKGDNVKPNELADLADGYLASFGDTHVWMLYKPDTTFLQSPDAALTLDLARKIAATDKHKKHLVFSPAKYVSHKTLRDEKLAVEHALIPFSLFTLERD